MYEHFHKCFDHIFFTIVKLNKTTMILTCNKPHTFYLHLPQNALCPVTFPKTTKLTQKFIRDVLKIRLARGYFPTKSTGSHGVTGILYTLITNKHWIVCYTVSKRIENINNNFLECDLRIVVYIFAEILSSHIQSILENTVFIL